MKDTIVVNLFAGPGAGKSTGAAYIFSMLKMAGIDTEYVNEYAKDKVWEDNKEVFKCQFLISGKQEDKRCSMRKREMQKTTKWLKKWKRQQQRLKNIHLLLTIHG